MIAELNKLEENRKILLSYTDNLTLDQYNEIPQGSNNNIIWNIGHLLVTGDDILYLFSQELQPVYTFDTIKYGKGSRPAGNTDLGEITLIREALSRTIEIYKEVFFLEFDKQGHELQNEFEIQPITKRGLQFLFFHEHMHYAKIAGLLRYLRQEA